MFLDQFSKRSEHGGLAGGKLHGDLKSHDGAERGVGVRLSKAMDLWNTS